MKKYFVILILLSLAIFISGCIGFLTTPGEDSIAPGKGRLEIYLTDSSEKYKAIDSENYLAVYITISKIEGHIAGEDEEAEGEFDAGKYTQLRLFVTEASVLVETKSKENKLIEVGTGGEPVEIPSAYQTGIKLIHPFEIVEGEETILTIDFDAEKSIIKTGNGQYKLQPVIKVITGSTDENGEED